MKYNIKTSIYPYDLCDITQKNNFINRYIELNQNIINYARENISTDNFLLIDVDEMRIRSDEDNWKVISDFLGIDKTMDKKFPTKRITFKN